MTEEKTTRIPSNALLQKINDIVGSFGRTRDKVIAAFELGRKEGFSDMEIGDLIRAGLKRQVSVLAIWVVFQNCFFLKLQNI